MACPGDRWGALRGGSTHLRLSHPPTRAGGWGEASSPAGPRAGHTGCAAARRVRRGPPWSTVPTSEQVSASPRALSTLGRGSLRLSTDSISQRPVKPPQSPLAALRRVSKDSPWHPPLGPQPCLLTHTLRPPRAAPASGTLHLLLHSLEILFPLLSTRWTLPPPAGPSSRVGEPSPPWLTLLPPKDPGGSFPPSSAPSRAGVRPGLSTAVPSPQHRAWHGEGKAPRVSAEDSSECVRECVNRIWASRWPSALSSRHNRRDCAHTAFLQGPGSR